MRILNQTRLLIVLLSSSLYFISPVFADDAETRATNALTSILFDNEAESFTSYRISKDGFVDIVFAKNTPDLTYSLILNQLKHHSDITGVLAGKGGPNCNLFR